MRKIILTLLALAALSACSSSSPRINADEKLPESPCACGPRVQPLGPELSA
jgi:uncharacterized protein YceK